MEKAEGVIVENNQKTSKVKIVRGSMCGDNCGSCNLCGKRETIVFAENNINAKKGDRVVLEMQSKEGLIAAVLVYGAPLLILILGIVIISAFNYNQAKGLLITLCVIVLYFLALKKLDRKMKPSAKVVEVIENETK